ncbi:hypothetical protein ACJIZ3_020736 [Penstemon smallii]|uniref:Dof zinc finger protein n=1 Tax=Penstemon smallii TaxID=265156 RepID=A0ABD3SK90_9LAMI
MPDKIIWMQDIHAIGDAGAGGGRFSGGGERRLRPHNHQAMKCPRCDSLNTKFCYYNNYNQSQPRHFCKSCRRYWTKGGVLRNVPVGGGCRKAKRSKPKAEPKSKAQSSSSESSSLTAATTTATNSTSAVAEEGLNSSFPDTVLFGENITQPLMTNHHSTDGQIFGSFTSLMTSSEQMMGFGIGEVPTTSYQGPAAEDELKMQEITGGGLDWGSGGDQGLFDLTAAVDPAYWSQTPWTDNDQSLNYLP